MAISKQNLNLQALRAIAALFVVVGHACGETARIGPHVGRPAVALSFFNWGIGVHIFFVISGFIMVYSSADLFGRAGSWHLFLVRRMTRIVPLYWLMTTVLLIGAVVAPSLLNVPIGDWRHVVASYLFIPSARTPDEIRPVMALGWTLNMEMFFYALFAGALTLRLRSGMIMLSLVMVTLAAIGLVVRPEQVQMAFWTQPIVLEFLFGCLLALLALKGARLNWSVATAAAMLGIAGCFFVPNLVGGGVLPDVVRWGLPALLIVAAAALSPRSTSRPLLGLAALGDASYSLYLVHPFILRPFREVWIALVGGVFPLQMYIVAALLVAALTAMALFRWVERPMLKWLQTRAKPFSPSAQRVPAQAAALSYPTLSEKRQAEPV